MVFFFIVSNSIEYKFLGITMIMHAWHVLIIGCVFYTLWLVSALSCIVYASHMHTISTLDAHTLSPDMFCIYSCYVSVFRLIALITCSCDYVCLSISILGQFIRVYGLTCI